MEYNGIQFLRPDPFLSEGITFLRHDPDWRPYYIPLQSRLTKQHSRLTPLARGPGIDKAGIPGRLQTRVRNRPPTKGAPGIPPPGNNLHLRDNNPGYAT